MYGDVVKYIKKYKKQTKGKFMRFSSEIKIF